MQALCFSRGLVPCAKAAANAPVKLPHTSFGARLASASRNPVSESRAQGIVRARKGSDAFDYQISWPYALLLMELAFVVLQMRTPLAILSVALVITQSAQDNWLLSIVAGSGLFSRYKDAKFFLSVLTMWTFATFLAACFVLSKA